MQDLIVSGRRTLRQQAEALLGLSARLDDTFSAAVALLLGCQGRVVVSGVGKSGLVARKIAATLSSTGTPALFLHPTDAVHGDLGVLSPQDVLLLLSRSGETAELLHLLPHARPRCAGLLALVGAPGSRLALAADVVLDVGVPDEACPLRLAPTTSTTAAMVVGDALAIALMEARGVRAADFARLHPAGQLGAQLRTVRACMVTADLPCIGPQAPLSAAIAEMTRGRLGLTVVTASGDPRQPIQGILTDGDLRRALALGPEALLRPVAAAMSVRPRWIHPDERLATAEEQLRRARITALLASEDGGTTLCGILHLHHL